MASQTLKYRVRKKKDGSSVGIASRGTVTRSVGRPKGSKDKQPRKVKVRSKA